MNKLLIGSHVDMTAPDFLVGSVKSALSYGANAFMVYTGAPQNAYRRPVSELRVSEAHELMKAHGIDSNNVVVHAPYIINLANCLNDELFEMSKKTLLIELDRVYKMGFKILVLHPGSHVKVGSEFGIKRLIDGLNDVLSKDNSDVIIALETMSGKGSEIGRDFYEIRQIIDGVTNKARIGVCLDTCHIFDSGIDLSDVDSLVKNIDKIIGLDLVKVIHVNDSKNEFGSSKDRHENIGYGSIGFNILSKIVHHVAFRNIPKILETPYVNEKAPYQFEIKMLKDLIFNPTLK